MAKSFTIPKKAYSGLSDLIEMGPERLGKLAGEVADRELTLEVESLAKKLAEAVNFSLDQIERVITSVLIPLSGLRAAFGMAPKEFLSLLGRLIQRQNEDWYKEFGAKWESVVPSVEPLLAPNSYFGQLYKTFNILLDRPTIAEEFKLLTELRPVYDEEAASLKAVVITSTLVINYNEGREQKRLYLTVDQEDLRALQEQLDRAEKKAQVLEEEVSKLKLPILIAGTE